MTCFVTKSKSFFRGGIPRRQEFGLWKLHKFWSFFSIRNEIFENNHFVVTPLSSWISGGSIVSDYGIIVLHLLTNGSVSIQYLRSVIVRESGSRAWRSCHLGELRNLGRILYDYVPVSSHWVVSISEITWPKVYVLLRFLRLLPHDFFSFLHNPHTVKKTKFNVIPILCLWYLISITVPFNFFLNFGSAFEE